MAFIPALAAAQPACAGQASPGGVSDAKGGTDQGKASGKHDGTDKAFLTLAYSAQAAGLDRDPDYSSRAFDLSHFERHAVRVRFGVAI